MNAKIPYRSSHNAVSSSRDSGHFLGTIVVAPNTEDSKKLDIIDGQQRLTTIFMLLYALIHKDETLKTEHQHILKKKGILKLEVAPQNREFFENLLQSIENGKLNTKLKKEANTQGKERLYEIFKAILDKVIKIKKEKLENYIETLLNMTLMWLVEEDSGRAIRTFQSVNDRGVQLTLLDKLKSLFIYYSNLYCDGAKNGLDSRINSAFGEIFAIFARIDRHPYKPQVSEDAIFRYHIGSIKFNEIAYLGHYELSNESAYEKLKDELKKLAKDCVDSVMLQSFIESYVSDLKAFYQAFLDLLTAIDTNPYVFKLFLLEKINPYFYNTLVRLKMNNELDDSLLQLFAKADILFFKSGSYLRSAAYNLTHSYTKGKESLKRAILKTRNKKAVDDAINNITNDALNTDAFHYIFFEQNCTDMDAADLKELVSKKQTAQEKEHIIPYAIWNNEDEAAAKRLGFDNMDDLGYFLDSYGNFLSLEGSLNAKARDCDFYDKEKVYKDSKIPYVRQFDVKNFHKNALIQRNEEFKKWAREVFFKEFLD